MVNEPGRILLFQSGLVHGEIGGENIEVDAGKVGCAWIAVLLHLFAEIFALQQVGELSEGGESRRSFLLQASGCTIRLLSHQIPLVLIVMTVET